MKDTSILLGVTGGIAAYKVADLCRLFRKAGAGVQVVMTESACEFITPLTLETLSGNPVPVKMFDPGRPGVAHVEMADKADLLVIAPATADFLARAAGGRASDLLAAITLAFDGPVVAAPAMNTNMWNHPATKRNIRILREDFGWSFVDPGEGELACGWTGPGRMAEPDDIFARVQSMRPLDLTGRRILVTAGPTAEDLDPVRFLSNRSTGRMGYAVAEVASLRGAEVVLVSGPTALPDPTRVECIRVRSALEMQDAVFQRAENADAIVMTAAVADFRPEQKAARKLKKEAGQTERVVRLVQNPDILAELGARFQDRNKPLLVGFALETENLIEAAKRKLEAKRAHLIVANLAADGLATNQTQATILDDRGHVEETGAISKTRLASKLIDLMIPRFTK